MAQSKYSSSSLQQFTLANLLQSFVLLSCCHLHTGSPTATQRDTTVHDINLLENKWAHQVNLNADFRVLWTITDEDVTFEMQVRAKGYVGLGFSVDGKQEGTDIAIGWVDNGYTYFQDRYVPINETLMPLVDPSQDYILIMGYENETHTVIRFRRKLDTCDSKHDIPITNDTMRVMYMYEDVDPLIGLSSLPNVNEAWHPYKPLVLTQPLLELPNKSEHTHSFEWRNKNAVLPLGDDTIIWCKIFQLNYVGEKSHLIRYEPIFDSSLSVHYLQRITLYECEGSLGSETTTLKFGSKCSGVRATQLPCNTYVATWTRGAEGFDFPPDVGYSLDNSDRRYFFMETHYNNLNAEFGELRYNMLTDSSGLRLYITDQLRVNEAGILSVGVDPNWHHIIPPAQNHVLSEGQCLEECTAYAFPSQGIFIFAVLMRTHQIGTTIKLRQIRRNKELPPIAYDNNIDPSHQIIRQLPRLVQSMPGDRLVTECVYDSSSRNAITLGGQSIKEESCSSLVLYYPRQRKLTSCHSMPSLNTVLNSLGIDYLAPNSSPIVISSPTELQGMTLENRLLTCDWKTQFKRFQATTLKGSFMSLCRGPNNNILPGLEHLVGHPANITERYEEGSRCKTKRGVSTDAISELKTFSFQDFGRNDIINSVMRSSRSSETLALSGFKSSARQLANFISCLGVSLFNLLVLIS